MIPSKFSLIQAPPEGLLEWRLLYVSPRLCSINMSPFWNFMTQPPIFIVSLFFPWLNQTEPWSDLCLYEACIGSYHSHLVMCLVLDLRGLCQTPSVSLLGKPMQLVMSALGLRDRWNFSCILNPQLACLDSEKPPGKHIWKGGVILSFHQ